MNAAEHCQETPGTPHPVWRARLEAGLVFVFAWSLPTSLFGMQVGLVAGAGWLVARLLASRGRAWRRSALDWPFLLLLAAVLLSWMATPLPLAEPGKLFAFWVWPAYFVVLHLPPPPRAAQRLFVGLLCLSAMVALFGIYQSFWGHYPLLSWIHPGRVLPQPAFGSPDRFMATGLFHSRISFAHMLLFPFCWMAAWLFEAGGWHRRLLLLAGICTLGLAMASSWSRTAPVAAVGALLVLALLRLRWLPRLLAAGGLIGLVLLGLALQPGLADRIGNSFSGIRDKGRLSMWQVGMDLASAHPLTGVGFGGFEQACRPLIETRVRKMGDSQFSGVIAKAHNDLLTFWAEAGVVGAFALVWLFVSWFRAVAARTRSTWYAQAPPWRRSLLQGSLAGVAALLATGFFHDHLFHGELVFMLLFAMGAALWEPAEAHQEGSPPQAES